MGQFNPIIQNGVIKFIPMVPAMDWEKGSSQKKETALIC